MLETGNRVNREVVLALVVTLCGAALAWVLAGRPPFIGIDDAAITRAYAENIANGHGYVYNIGGERVEGSTSLAWTLIVALVYRVARPPEVAILAVTFLATSGSVLIVLRLTRLLAARAGIGPDIAVAIVAAGMLGLPGFFFWSVWTMMELAIWSTALLGLVYGLALIGETGRRPVGVVLAAGALPLIRPEGIAVAVGLCGLAVLICPGRRRMPLVAIAAAIGAFVAATGFRLAYFGQPLPNTYYAKVSSDKVQDLVDGLKYLAGFINGAPFAGTLLIVWVLAALLALEGILATPRPAARGALIAAAGLFGMLLTYAALGGDHFALWRFYQPVAPLLPVAAALGLALAWPRLAAMPPALRIATPLAALGFWLGVTSLHYYQSRFLLVREVTLVERGIAFGAALNALTPRPSVGVGPAGGIALAYDGTIRDLFGLNWIEMARANPVKEGMRNHASFDPEVFWRHPPDILSQFDKDCPDGGPMVLEATAGGALKGLLAQPAFEARYTPFLFRADGRCWPGFAARDWLARAQDPGLEPLDWSAVDRR